MGNKAIKALGCAQTHHDLDPKDPKKDKQHNLIKKREGKKSNNKQNNHNLNKESFIHFKNLLKENSFSPYLNIEQGVIILGTNCYKRQIFISRKWQNLLEIDKGLSKVKNDVRQVKFLARK